MYVPAGCTLEKVGATEVKNSSCVSGTVQPGNGALPCRESAKLDCSLSGSCINGTCTCTGGFSGGSCGLVPESFGSCNVQAGLCLDSTSPLPPPFGQHSLPFGQCKWSVYGVVGRHSLQFGQCIWPVDLTGRGAGIRTAKSIGDCW